jgi:hypothetical protein
MLVDQEGLWWLGDFGSAVPKGQKIHSTTQVFAPEPCLIGKPAQPYYDWYVGVCTAVGLKHSKTR